MRTKTLTFVFVCLLSAGCTPDRSKSMTGPTPAAGSPSSSPAQAATPAPPSTATATPATGAAKISFTGCDRRAGELPGFINCRGTLDITINQANKSGYVSAFFAWPDSGSFYHGDIRVTKGRAPGKVRISVVNNYVPRCPSSGPSTLSLYDGPQSGSNIPVISRLAITLSGC